MEALAASIANIHLAEDDAECRPRDYQVYLSFELLNGQYNQWIAYNINIGLKHSKKITVLNMT